MGPAARTPLPPLDRIGAAAFWERYLSKTGDPSEPTCADVACFGDSVELADELLALVFSGRKRATAGSVADYDADGLSPPKPGERWIACDGQGRARVVIRTAEVRVGPLSSVDEAF
ncbi:MAG: ASCH domain-containing protein, partial [Gaiellaceae bacterium]